MKRLAKPFMLAGITAALLAGSTNLMAQGQGGGQGRGNFDREEARQRMNEMYQERLGMSADEWKAVQPLFEAVQTKQLEAIAGAFGGFGGFGRGGGGGRGGDQGGGAGGGGGRGRGFGGTPSPEAEALQKAVDSGDAAEIKAKLESYRASRKKKEAELQTARDNLRKVLTAKQEAQLVLMGTLN